MGHKWQFAGVDKGILGMCVNERRRITVPPHLAYSSQAAGNFYIDKMYILVHFFKLSKQPKNYLDTQFLNTALNFLGLGIRYQSKYIQ